MTLTESLTGTFKRIFHSEPHYHITVPGRANLIGEHTDYNDGYVFPVAIDRYVEVLAAPTGTGTVRLYSLLYNEQIEFPADEIPAGPAGNWYDYQRGVAAVLNETGYRLSGADLLISGAIPLGAGLSSSAAVELAAMFAFRALFSLDINGPDAAKLCQRAENVYAGMNCGIMDQFACAMGKKDHALFLDCRNLEYSYSPLVTDEWKIVLINSNVPHKLTESAYNQRRDESFTAAGHFAQYNPAVTHLRDVEPDLFERYKSELPKILQKRAQHVITENTRTLKGAELLKSRDIEGFGQLMNESHESLSGLYEVSSPELDLLAALARKSEGVAGSRMMGGGFGGCTISLVRDEAVDLLKTNVLIPYREKTGIEPELYLCCIVDGVSSSKIKK